MKLPFSIYLALKYLKPKRTFISAVTVISVLGVVLGVAVLVIVLSVMNGFDVMWRDKILGFDGHIMIESAGGIEDPELVLDAVERIEGVMGVSPYIQQLAFLPVGDHVFTPLVRGVDGDRDALASTIRDHIQVPGEFIIEEGIALIGSDLARQAGLGVGDTVLVYSPHGFADLDEHYLPLELTIGGIFEMGMWEFDVGFLLTAMETARDLAHIDAGVTTVQVVVEDPVDSKAMHEVVTRIENALGELYVVRTWEELRVSLFAALRVEKNLMFLLLLCITLVAAFSICNTLITLTVQKTREIGLLKAVGFTPGNILRVFLWQGWIQGAVGLAFGVVIGMSVLYYRNDLLGLLDRKLDYELLPKSLYNLDEMPAITSIRDIVVVSILVMIICTVAAVIPAIRAARLEPAQALRYE